MISAFCPAKAQSTDERRRWNRTARIFHNSFSHISNLHWWKPGLKKTNAKTQVFHLNVPSKHLEAVLNCLFEGKERALPLLLTSARGDPDKASPLLVPCKAPGLGLAFR